MTKFLQAGFDGKLRPTEPVGLKPNTRVRLTLEVDESTTEVPKSFYKLRGLELDGSAE